MHIGALSILLQLIIDRNDLICLNQALAMALAHAQPHALQPQKLRIRTP